MWLPCSKREGWLRSRTCKCAPREQQGGFQSLTNKWGSDWETPNAPAFPLDINIVGADGEAVGCPVLCPVLCPLLSSVLCTERLWSN